MSRVTTFVVLVVLAGSGVARAQEPYRVFRARGTVNVKDKNGNWRVIPGPSGSDQVAPGETVKTEGGSCLLLTASTDEAEVKVGVGPDSEAECKPPDPGEIRVPTFNLSRGSAYCSVLTKAKKQGVVFKIQTDVGVTGVVGTEFLVYRDSVGMRTVVGESRVMFSDRESRSCAVDQLMMGLLMPWDKARLVAKSDAGEEAALAALRRQVGTIVVKSTTTVDAMVKAKPDLEDRLVKWLQESARKTSSGAEVDGATLKKELETLLGASVGQGALWVVPAADFDGDAMTTLQSYRNEFKE